MKSTIKIAAMGLTLAVSYQGIPALQAQDKGTVTEEARMSSSREGTPMKSAEDFSSLKKGDRFIIFHKNDKGVTTVITSVDKNGLAKWNETKNGSQLDGGQLITRKKENSREVETLVMEKDGTLTPVEVRRVKAES